MSCRRKLMHEQNKSDITYKRRNPKNVKTNWGHICSHETVINQQVEKNTDESQSTKPWSKSEIA